MLKNSEVSDSLNVLIWPTDPIHLYSEGVTHDIGIGGGGGGSAYEGSNPDPKIWVHQNCISEF